MNELLRIEALEGADGATPKLHRVNLAVGVGETVALLGGAGAGKSALLRAIVGLQPPETGRILLRNEPIEHLPPDRILERGVALSAQHRRVFRSLSLTENLLLGAVHLTRAEARDGLEQVFELMPGLATRRRRPVRVEHGLIGGRGLDLGLILRGLQMRAQGHRLPGQAQGQQQRDQRSGQLRIGDAEVQEVRGDLRGRGAHLVLVQLLRPEEVGLLQQAVMFRGGGLPVDQLGLLDGVLEAPLLDQAFGLLAERLGRRRGLGRLLGLAILEEHEMPLSWALPPVSAN
jgi:ABC-type Fe3+/spermidine/putrescine transport system ATPase subunit